MDMKSETEVEVTFAESEHPRRPWITPCFARLDLANARADPCGQVHHDGASVF
jgi:hypothetical protein